MDMNKNSIWKVLKKEWEKWEKETCFMRLALNYFLEIWKSNDSLHPFCHFPPEGVICLPHFKCLLKWELLTPSALSAFY